MNRGEIWYANLEPTKGYEQAGERPIIILQNNLLNKILPTIIAIPLTTNLKQASKRTCVLLPITETGLEYESVALCHQIRVLDKRRLDRKIGKLSENLLYEVEKTTFFSIGFTSLLVISGISVLIKFIF